MEKIKYKTHKHKIQQMKLHAKDGDNGFLQNNYHQVQPVF